MTMLKNRAFAAFLTVVVICSSTVFSANRTLGAQCRAVSDSFYDGVYDSVWGTLNRSIQFQLDRRCEAANGLATVAANYSELSDLEAELRSKRIALLGKYEISDKYSANKELQSAFSALYSAFEAINVTARDKEMLTEYSAAFRSAQNFIDGAGYNEAVRELERSALSVFPANFIRVIAGIKAPELFE